MRLRADEKFPCAHHGIRRSRKNFVPPVGDSVTVLTPLLRTGVPLTGLQAALEPAAEEACSTTFEDMLCQLSTSCPFLAAANNLGTSARPSDTVVFIDACLLTRFLSHMRPP